MALAPQLSATKTHFETVAPANVVNTIQSTTAEFKASYDTSSAIKPGSILPPFTLPNTFGEHIFSTDLLAQGPILITFYRGGWCPFCNLALHSLQLHLPKFREKGVTLVAISPELPDSSITTAEKQGLQFPVLSDVGNKYAAELGILYAMPDSLRPVFEGFGHSLKARNGDDSFVVPVPATMLVTGDGIVRNVFVEADYTKRLEPATALEWVDGL